MPNDCLVDLTSNFSVSRPTRACLVCDRRENPKADTVIADAAWLCDKCKSALLKVVEREGANDEQAD